MELLKLFRLTAIVVFLFLSVLSFAAGNPPNLSHKQGAEDSDDDNWTYSTNGVHSDYGCSEANNHCIAIRNALDPKDPEFPQYWISDWTMFTVLNEAASTANPPPYTNPPATLNPNDYLVSYGTSYYDNTYRPDDVDDPDNFGAMMEFYNNFCLPIFGKTLTDNSITCAFVSLGKKAFYLEFGQEEPSCCQFSPNNHPPRPDFIKHLDYWPEASKNLNDSVQAYYWKDLWSPDAPQKILFAYAFNKYQSPQGQMPKQSRWYQHPQSFFFSGMITLATSSSPVMIEPIISQNYTSFRSERPDPKIWQQVTQWCPVDEVKKCHLFPGQ